MDLTGFGLVLLGFVILRLVFSMTRLQEDLANAFVVSIPLAVGFTHSLWVNGRLHNPWFLSLTGLIIVYSFITTKKFSKSKIENESKDINPNDKN